MNQNLTEYLHRYIEITETEIKHFQSYLKPRSIKKKEFLLKSGKVCTSRYYIVNGCFKMFYFDDKANEQILHFGIDNWWMTEYESLINKTPSKLNIQALEDSELLELTDENFKKVTKEIPEIYRMFMIIAEKTFIASQRRLSYMLSYSGEELFRVFTSKNAAFCQRVPQYLIASYLGMTPEFFSKIRGRMK